MKTTKTIDVDLTVQDLAELFACLDDAEQAQFFELVRDYAEAHFPQGRFGSQMQWNSMSRRATPRQREALMEISSSSWLHASNYLREQPSGDW